MSDRWNTASKDYNLIIIVVDALRAKNLSCYGYPKKTTPFMDSLARNGVLFENAYANTDQTDPAFTSIFSGRYPITHGIIFHGNFVTPDQINTLKKTNTRFLAEILKEHDPEMVTIGIDWLSRWHKTGFDYYGEDEILPNKNALLVKYKWLNEKMKKFVNQFSKNWYYFFNKLFSPFGFKYRNDAEGYFEYARMAIDRYAKDKNFYLLIHLWDVHSPWHMLPKAYIRKFCQAEPGNQKNSIANSLKRYKSQKFRKKAEEYHLKGLKYLAEVESRYNAALNYVDFELFKFVEFLKAEGLWSNTYLLITADHGENLVVNGKFVSHMGTKNVVMKVPLILVGPKLPHKRIPEMVQHIDILPTLMELFQIQTKYRYDGKSALPLLKGEKIKWRDEIFFVGSAAKKRYALLNDRFKFSYSPTKEDCDDGVDGLWYSEQVELYDLKNDPEEVRNSAAENSEVAKIMEQMIKQFLDNLNRKKEKYILEGSLKKLKFTSKKN